MSRQKIVVAATLNDRSRYSAVLHCRHALISQMNANVLIDMKVHGLRYCEDTKRFVLQKVERPGRRTPGVQRAEVVVDDSNLAVREKMFYAAFQRLRSMIL